MKDRSFSTPFAVTLTVVVIAFATFLQVIRHLSTGASFTDTALFLLFVVLALVLAVGVAWLFKVIGDTQIGRVLRASIAVLFCVSLVTAIVISVLIRLPSSDSAQHGVPQANMLALQISALVSLLCAPVGWRALVDYLSKRSTASMRFFRASPATLCFVFVLTTGVVVAAGTSDFPQMLTASIGTNMLWLVSVALLACLSLTIPLLLFTRLLQISGSWLRRRWATR